MCNVKLITNIDDKVDTIIISIILDEMIFVSMALQSPQLSHYSNKI